MNALIELKDLSIGYTKKKNTKIVHKGLSAKLYAGELTCLLGPNGAGKSTLLRTLCGFQEEIDGDIYINGLSSKEISPKDLAKMISVVLTEKVSIPNLTVHELVAYGRSPYTGFFGRLSEEDKRLIDEAILMVGIADMSDRKVKTLSDGERQKVMIAKALVQDTPVVFLDEPAAFLDLPSKLELMQLLHRLSNETNKLIFVVTHDLDLALQTADKIWLLANNKPLELGVPEDLIIQDKFKEFFVRDGISFDKNTGLFKINNSFNKKISVTGFGLEYNLLRRALSRNGIDSDTTNDSNIKVEVLAGPLTKYVINYNGLRQEFATIEYALSYIKNL